MSLKPYHLCFIFLSSVFSADEIFHQENNNAKEECVVEGNEAQLRRIKLTNCDWAKNLLRQNKFPQTCGFNETAPKVCCPIATRTRLKQYGDLAKNACVALKTALSDETERLRLRRQGPVLLHNIISGGVPAEEKEFKHLALVGFDDNGRVSWQCGGSLISKQFVLTAAHCLYAKGLGHVKYVRLGELDYTIVTDATLYQDFNVSNIFKHPNYTYPATYNDIALLQLDRPAIYDEFVGPACLHTEKEINTTDGELVVAGWGKTEAIAEEGSSHLRKANVEAFSYDDCNEVYAKDSRKLATGIDDELQFCAGSYTDESNTCQGDSGGPLELEQELTRGTFSTIVGVTSFGKACGFPGIPGVYTRVSNYIEWIEDIVWRENNTSVLE